MGAEEHSRRATKTTRAEYSKAMDMITETKLEWDNIDLASIALLGISG